MKVVWFCHNSDIGGAELCLAEAVTSLRRFGVESHVLLPWAGTLEGYLGTLGIPVSRHRFRWWMSRPVEQTLLGRGKRAIRNAAALPLLLVRLRSLRPDVVVTNTLTIPAGAIAARMLGIPHVWYIHELGHEDMELYFDWGEERSVGVMNRLTTRAVVVSNAVREKFRRWIPADRLDLVYNAAEVPVRPRVQLPPLDGPLRLVTVGKKHAGKGQEQSVRAVALLARQGIDCHLTLAGREDPEYGAYLRELVRELGVEDRVLVKRFVPDAFSEIEKAHAFVMSSHNEAFGRVTIESMKLGRPVIGSDTAGTVEFIQHGWNGLLYRAEDPDDLAEKIRVLHEDRARLVEMAENAQEWATPRFTLDRYSSEFYAALCRAAGDDLSGAAAEPSEPSGRRLSAPSVPSTTRSGTTR